MNRGERRADRIRLEVPIEQVLANYGFEVRVQGGSREQQFRCSLHGDGNDGKPSARCYPENNSWYCVDVDTPILTAEGWVRLGDIKAGMWVADGLGNWAPCLAYLDRGTRETLRIQTNSGYSVVVTPDHEVFSVSRGWVRADALLIGEEVSVVAPTSLSFPSSVNLPKDSGGREDSLYSWTLPLGEVLGYLVGDGHVTHRPDGTCQVGITSSMGDAEDALGAFSHLSGMFGGGGSRSRRTEWVTHNGYRYLQDKMVFSKGSKHLGGLLVQLGIDKRKDVTQRRVPHSLWSAPHEAIRGFLRGLFASDGSIYFARGRPAARVCLYSVSMPLLLGVQLLLLQFGIRCRVHAQAKTLNRDGTPRSCRMLQLATSRDNDLFRSHIGFANKRKQDLLDLHVFRSGYHREPKSLVASLLPAGPRQVADLAMPWEHSFVAGGIRVHNCWACGRSRDAIQTVREKEGLSFHASLERLERMFSLPSLPWEDGDNQEAPTDPLAGAFDRPEWTFENEAHRVGRLVSAICTEKALALALVLGLVEDYDRILNQAQSNPDDAMRSLERLRYRIQAVMGLA